MFFNKNLLFAFLGWLLLIFFKGYTLGIEDQQELLPYILSFVHPELYPNDFFISHLKEIIPNERYFFSYLLVPFIQYFDPLLLIFHAITTTALLLGMYSLGRMFIQSDALTWLTVYGSLIFLYLYTLGGCELYYNTFQSSNVAKAIGIWAILFFLQEKYYISSILLGISTYIQIIVGLDTMLILSSVLLFQKKLRPLGLTLLLYISLAGFYLFSILLARSTNVVVDMETYYRILFEFRHPHHFIFSHFGIKQIFIFTFLNVVACYFFYQKNKNIFYFILSTNIGLIIYYIGLEKLHLIPIANFNFYKMSIWVKFFGCIAFVAILEKKFENLPWMDSLESSFKWILLLIPILFFGLIFGNYLNLFNKPIMIGNRIYQDPLIDISIKTKKITDPSAVFIVPFDATGFKYYSQRNSYVDFKANTRTPQTMTEWYRRIQLVYNISMNDTQKGFDLKQNANTFYNQIDSSRIALLKKEKVTHVLLPHQISIEKLGVNLLISNDHFMIIEL